jgi:4-hydroxy-tetrahydrodipicolinate synthase
MRQVEGVCVVLLSPFRTGNVDEAALRHMVEHFVTEGVHGLVVLGSNGEFPYLTDEEKRRLIDVAVDQARGRVPVIVGTGYMGTDQTVALTKCAREAGANAALIALPIYYPLGFADVKRHYRRIATEAELPILYYNIPDATHLKLAPAEIAELATIDRIIGVKETILDVGEMGELVKLVTKQPFSVLSGTVLNLMPVMEQGGCGAICVLPNLVPGKCVEFYNALKSGNAEKTGEIMAFLFKFLPLMTATPTPHAMMKEAMRQLGHPIEPTAKDPLPPLTNEQKELVSRVLADAGLTP